MLTKSRLFLLCAALAVILAGCDDLGYTGGTQGGFDNAEDPVITVQPAGGRFTLGAGAKLTITASVADGGTLSYQWYTATDEEYVGYTDAEGNDFFGTEIGTNSPEYTIDLTEGTWQVYVLVTNTNNEAKGEKTASVKSDLVRVIINDPANAEYPYITAEPKSTGYDWPLGSQTIDPLTVTADVQDGGTLTYQWYSSASYASAGGTPATGAGASGTLTGGAPGGSYTPSITAEGTYYYYAVIKNTTTGKTGRNESETASSPAVIKAVAANATVNVSATKLQYVRGFGVMANFFDNAPQDYVKDYEKMFNPNGLGYNILRIMVPVDNTDDPTTDMKVIMEKVINKEIPRGTPIRDRSHYYEIVKLANRYGGYVLASPWSPPREWKTNNSINGGGAGAKANLKKEYWQDYADYLKQYCRIMYDKGAPIYAISIQNEPNFNASYDGCEWTGQEMRDFFLQVGHFTDGVKGWGGGRETPYVLTMFGESANSPTDTDFGLNDAEANQYIDLYARHLYGSQTVTRAPQVQAKGKEMWMTEHNINADTNVAQRPFDSEFSLIWKFLNSVDVSIRVNSENAYIWWHGKRFYSMIGDGDAGTVDGVILTRGWALAHYAKFANETDRIRLALGAGSTTASGAALTEGGERSNFNPVGYDVDSVAARATAFMSKDGNSISLVMFTPTKNDGSDGLDMGNVKINFPAGFTATKVTAMRSKGEPRDKTENMGKADGETVLLKGGNAAVVNLPRGQVLSVRFTK